uniref:ATP synthase complex subunit 8 n=1 Tax=Hermerius intermedia TaxID=2547835 RepID=A0A7G8JRT6_9CUCU|nr:ATP synthase F0 subunit 8 [Hermerius intermedia]
MPQMAPLNWLSLAIMFVLVFLVFNVINYFTISYETKILKTKKEKIFFDWKW